MRFVILTLAVLGACSRAEERPGAAGEQTSSSSAANPIAPSPAPPVVLSVPRIDARIPSTTALTWRFRAPVTNGLLILAADQPATLDVAVIVRTEELRGESFILEHAPPGLHTAFVRGWRTRWHQQPVYIREDETTDLGTIELEPFPSADMVDGILRDVSGKPAGGFQILEVVQESGLYDVVTVFHFATPAFSDGTFLVCPGTSPCRFEAFARGCAWNPFGARWGSKVDVIVVCGGDERIVPLESRRRTPIASGNERGSTVLMGLLVPPVLRGRLLLARGWVQTLEGASIAFAEDIDGELFRFEDIPAGTYTLFVRSWRSRWHREPVQLHEGELTDLGAIELELVPSEDFLEGTVRDERGAALPGVRIDYGATVDSAAADATGTSTLTREDGSFLVIPPESPTRLRLRKTGYTPQEVKGRADRLLDVVLRRDS